MSTSAEFQTSVLHDHPLGYWTLDGSGFYTAPTYNNVVIGDVGSGGWGTFIVFDVTIPVDSVIVSAHLSGPAAATDSGDVNVTIYLENVASGNDPANAAAANAMTLTTGTAWGPVPTFISGTTYESVDFASDLQTVINRSDYVTNNCVNVVIRNSSSNSERLFNGTGNIELHVVYDTAPTRTISGAISRFGTGINSVTMTFSAGLGGGTVETSGGGLYTKSIANNLTGTVTPSKTGDTFTPTSKSYTGLREDKTSENYTMDMPIVPVAGLAYTTRTPTYLLTSNIPVVSIAYTTHLPSRNYYEISTAGITFSALEPVYSTGFVDVRKRLNLNAIGERLSLKFQNVESVDLVLNDVGFTITELYRRKGVDLNAKGNRISLKFQNNDLATPFELQYLKLFEEIYEYQFGTKMNVKGNHLSFKFQNNTSATPFELQYQKIKGDIYENQ